MSRRHNQYRNRRTRAAGSDDMDWQDKKRVCDIMTRHGYDTVTNLYLSRPRHHVDEHPQLFLLTHSISEVGQKLWKLVARPDVACYLDANIKLLVEIDGGVHKKDLDERPLYTELGIPHIIINKAYLKKEGITWEAWIDEGLQRIREASP